MSLLKALMGVLQCIDIVIGCCEIVIKLVHLLIKCICSILNIKLNGELFHPALPFNVVQFLLPINEGFLHNLSQVVETEIIGTHNCKFGYLGYTWDKNANSLIIIFNE